MTFSGCLKEGDWRSAGTPHRDTFWTSIIRVIIQRGGRAKKKERRKQRERERKRKKRDREMRNRFGDRVREKERGRNKDKQTEKGTVIEKDKERIVV